MNKIIQSAILLLVLLFGFTAFFTTVPSTFAYDRKIIKSAAEYGYPPFSVEAEDGSADGFSVELLRASLEAVDHDVDFYVGPWSEVKEDLKEGRIQVLPLVGRTPEREGFYDFTFPYITFHGAIFVRSDEKSIKTKEDLVGKEVLVLKGDNAQEYAIREGISKHIIALDTYEEAFELLSEGKHDAVVVQELVGTQLLSGLEIRNVKPLDARLYDFRQDFTFAVKEGDKELLSLLNEGLAIVIADGTYDELHSKWFGPITKTDVSTVDIFKYVVIVIIPIIIILVIVSNFVLRKQVKKKVGALAQRRAELEKINMELEITRKKAEKRLADLERLNKLMVGRELKMVELKEKLNDESEEADG